MPDLRTKLFQGFFSVLDEGLMAEGRKQGICPQGFFGGIK